jgi:hypothetical protein
MLTRGRSPNHRIERNNHKRESHSFFKLLYLNSIFNYHSAKLLKGSWIVGFLFIFFVSFVLLFFSVSSVIYMAFLWHPWFFVFFLNQLLNPSYFNFSTTSLLKGRWNFLLVFYICFLLLFSDESDGFPLVSITFLGFCFVLVFK